MEKKEWTPEQKEKIVQKYDEYLEREYNEAKKRVKLLENKEQSKLAYELQKRLMQCCIDYIKETGNTEIYKVNFTADCLQESAKHGKWCACTDSVCELENEVETISFSA